MARKRIKLKLKENTSKARSVKFSADKKVRDKIALEPEENISKTVYSVSYPEVESISLDLERDARRYSSFWGNA